MQKQARTWSGTLGGKKKREAIEGSHETNMILNANCCQNIKK